MFIERLNQLLKERNLTRSKFLSDLNMGKNQFKYWETKGTPNAATISAIANYFGVSTDYLSGASNVKSMSANDDTELNEYLEELKIRPEMKTLFSLTKGATKEEVEQAIAIIEALQKVKENNG